MKLNRLSRQRNEEENKEYALLQRVLQANGYGLEFNNPPKRQILEDAIKLIQNMQAQEVKLKDVKDVYIKQRDMLQTRCNQLEAEGFKPVGFTSFKHSAKLPIVPLHAKVEGPSHIPSVNLVSVNQTKKVGSVNLSSLAGMLPKHSVKTGGFSPSGMLVLSNFVTAKYLNTDPVVPRNSEKKMEDIGQLAQPNIISRETEGIKQLTPTSMVPSCTTPGRAVSTRNLPTSYSALQKNSVSKTESSSQLEPASFIPSNRMGMSYSTVPSNQFDNAEDTTNVQMSGLESRRKPPPPEQIPQITNMQRSGSPACRMQRISTKIQRCNFCKKWISGSVFQSHRDECRKHRIEVGEKQVSESDLKILVKSGSEYKVYYWKPNKHSSQYPKVRLLDISKVSRFQLELGKHVKQHSKLGKARKMAPVDKCMVCERWIIGKKAILRHHSFSKLGICKLWRTGF